jgi:L-lactate dehydrogenase complex protein LldG
MVGAKIVNDARERVLAAVSQALADVRGREHPLPPVLDLAKNGGGREALAERFAIELTALAGTCALVADNRACAAAVGDYLRGRAVQSVAVQSRPLAQDIASQLSGFDVTSATAHGKTALERYDCSLLQAESLLADTGSAIVIVDNASDRVLPYLPRTSVIVAGLSVLHATMDLSSIACIREAAASRAPGEALIVAGPSRTADIEKTLVLGAHGPQGLGVFIVKNA